MTPRLVCTVRGCPAARNPLLHCAHQDRPVVALVDLWRRLIRRRP